MDKKYGLSYLKLRQIIGGLGILLPTVCILFGVLFGGIKLNSSISAYYYSNIRDFFVGLLICVGIFMSTYGGYTKIDRVVSIILAISSIGIAIFPCYNSEELKVGIFQLTTNASNVVHLISASTFFLTLAFNSLFLFTKTNPLIKSTDEKKNRNLVYRICGITIFVAAILNVIYVSVMPKELVSSNGAVLFFETIMLYAFGTSWLVKGGAILKDGE